jgi:hypothetical protein
MTKEEYFLNPNKCNVCLSIIEYNSRARVRNRKYCNLQCFSKSRTIISIEDYEKNPLKCCECKEIISFNKKKNRKLNVYFCGNKCAALYRGRNFKLSDAGLKSIVEKQKILQKKVWTKEKRLEHSLKMKKAVNDNPESYSSKNVCGRVKTIKTIDSLGNETSCLGKWELLVIDYLNKNNIRWSNKIEENFQYYWNESYHRYFPDFKLIDYDNVFIEVKGYERDRDKAKWEQFPHKLIIIKKEEIEKLKTNKFQLTFENLAV